MSEAQALRPAERLPDEVIDAAIGWAVKLDYGGPPEPQLRQAFEAWLVADPLHLMAWHRVGSLKGEFAKLPAQLASQTLRAASMSRPTHRRREALKLLSLAGLGLSTAWVLHEHRPWQRLLADAGTAVGQRRVLRLSDGSMLALNTDSAVSADLRGTRRLLRLHRGEVMITTGADEDAPARREFWLQTPFGRMQALGTRFVVRLYEDRARVSVQEGAVALYPTGGGSTAVVQAGESRWLGARATEAVLANGFEDDAWAEGVIAGKNIRLDDLLAELSRYRRGRIDCDARVAGLRLSGVFHIDDSDRTLDFLAQTQPIRLRYLSRYWVMVGPQ